MTTERTPLRTIPLQRWFWALIISAIFLLALSFNSRLATIRQMSQDEARLEQSVAAEEARQADLQVLRSYVASDAYVEHWARVDARMVEAGEVPVIPVAPSAAQVVSTPAAPLHAPATTFEEWWSVFFGETASIP